MLSASTGDIRAGIDAMNPSTMRIALNATPLLSPLTGIGQYTASLATHLELLGIDLHLFYGRRWSREILAAPIKGIETAKTLVKKWVPRPYRVIRAAQQAAFSLGARTRRPDLYHDPTGFLLRFDGPSVATVHDLSWLRFPDAHPPDRVDAYRRMFDSTLALSAHIITDAESTRSELIGEFGASPDRVTAIPLAARAIFSPRTGSEAAQPLAAHGLGFRRFLLAVGTVEPRKNLEAVVRAYSSQEAQFRERLPLVLVGMSGWLTAAFDTLVSPMVERGEVRRLGYVSDDELAALYASARAVIYPSLYEGFGLPPLEAMASGTPVIVSNVSSLPEVVGDAGIQVDPHDVEALREAIRVLSEDDERWEALRSAGLARAARFSWERCARETLAVYRKVLA